MFCNAVLKVGKIFFFINDKEMFFLHFIALFGEDDSACPVQNRVVGILSLGNVFLGKSCSAVINIAPNYNDKLFIGYFV